MRIVAPILFVVGAFVLGVMVGGVLVAAKASDDVVNAITGLVIGLAIFGAALIYWSLHAPHERRMIVGAKRHLGAAIGIGLATGFVMRFVVGAITLLGEAIDPGIEEKLNELAQDIVPGALWQKLLLAFGLVILAPFGEELLFRGLLLRGLARRMSFGWAAIVSSLLFGLAHASYWQLWPATLGVVLFGLAAAWIYRWYGYPAAVAAHMLFNGVVAIVLFVDPSQFTST